MFIPALAKSVKPLIGYLPNARAITKASWMSISSCEVRVMPS